MTRARAVAVYPMYDSWNFLAIQHAVRGGVEAPAGAVEPGERLEEAARRELREETGLGARRLIRLGSVPARGGGACAVFLARGLYGRRRGSPEGRLVWATPAVLLGPYATFRRQNRTVIQRIDRLVRRGRIRV